MFLRNKNLEINQNFIVKNDNVLLMNIKEIEKKKLKKFYFNLDFFNLMSFKINKNIRILKKIKNKKI